jgi:hypothetical protein
MPWWGWVVLGAVLLGAETVIPADFFLVFLGLAALAVGGLAALGLAGPASLQWVLFGVLAVVFLVFFRERVRERFRVQGSDPRVDDTLVGEIAVAREELAPGAVGRAELRGSAWSARNDGDAPLAAGARARVERVEGLLLHVRAEP